MNIRSVQSSSTIHINSDGSISPEAAPISTADNITYTVTDYIYDRIVIERSDIVLDGAGYVVQGAGGLWGIFMTRITNATIKNFQIKTFTYGIYLDTDCRNNYIYNNKITNIREYAIGLNYSTNNTITENYVAINKYGILLYYSPNCTITGNTITESNLYGIGLSYSSDNNVSGNNITGNKEGFRIGHSSHCTVYENDVVSNYDGIYLLYSSGNTFYHNSFANNIHSHVSVLPSDYANTWDSEGEGNYWSDYEEKYPNATEINETGMWDTPYVINQDNQDNHPLVIPEFPSFLILPLFMIASLLAVIIYRKKLTG